MMTGRGAENPGASHASASGGFDRDELKPRLHLLEHWLERAVPAEGLAWLHQTLEAVAQDDQVRALPPALALARRRLGKADLPLEADDFRRAGDVRDGFDPTGLTVDQTARIAFLLASYRDPASFARMLEALTRTADLGELVSYYRGSALLPISEDLTRRAADGIRSGMKPVFEAVAHRNPYPREAFDQSAWNQMVLKALFIGSALSPIQGLDDRANPELSAMLIDYAHERWAAHRPISIELWRGLGDFVNDRAFAALERLLASADRQDRAAAVLVLRACNHPLVADLLTRARDLNDEAAAGRITWPTLLGRSG